jgi:hypothetical protein
MKRREVELRKRLWEVFTATIYHGSHFSKSRDRVVIRKDVDYVMELLKEACAEDEEELKLTIEMGHYL